MGNIGYLRNKNKGGSRFKTIAAFLLLTFYYFQHYSTQVLVNEFPYLRHIHPS